MFSCLIIGLSSMPIRWHSVRRAAQVLELFEVSVHTYHGTRLDFELLPLIRLTGCLNESDDEVKPSSTLV